jgi:hypothetical protein
MVVLVVAVAVTVVRVVTEQRVKVIVGVMVVLVAVVAPVVALARKEQTVVGQVLDCSTRNLRRLVDHLLVGLLVEALLLLHQPQLMVAVPRAEFLVLALPLLV